MPGQSGSEERQKRIAFPVRLDDEEHVRLQDVADAAGCSRAEVLRRLVRAEHEKIIPSRAMVSELSAIGNNVNQVARALNALAAKTGGARLETWAVAENTATELRNVLAELTALLLKMRS